MAKAPLNLIRWRVVWYAFSVVLMLAGTFAPYVYPLHFGIDLIGGDILELKTNLPPGEVQKIVNLPVVSTRDSLVIKGAKLDRAGILASVQQRDPQAEVLRFEAISPALSGELRKKAITAVALVLLGIGLYVAFAFRQRAGMVSGWTLGAVVILTLFHDVVASFGIFTVLAHFLQLDFDILVISGFLVIAGFSVHDTIVVFDRLRERMGQAKNLSQELFNASVTETMARSINTSLTAVLSVIPLVVLLPHLHSFLLPLLFGIVTGTYSSIAIAVPLVYDLSRGRG